MLLNLLGVAGVLASPAPQFTAPPETTVAPDACAKIASATDAQLAADPAATPTVPASIAYDCLQTVPNKVEPAQKLINSIKAFVQWQSTLAWLKDPPASYMLPAVDIEAGLDTISTQVDAGDFLSEYEFGLAIVELFASAHDGHFAFRPDVFKGFTFRNSLAFDLVSVSRDGLEIPKLYHYADLNDTLPTGDAAMPAAVVEINGQDAAAVIEGLDLKFSSFQDPDSQWNSQFQTYATPDALPIVGASLAYQGPSTTFTYDNGENKTAESFAIIRPGANFTGVVTGEDYYQRFCNPDLSLAAEAASSTTSTSSSASSTETATTLAAPEPTIQGFPFPVIRDSGSNTTAGYFLNGTGYDDVAVLSVLGFSPFGTFDTIEYLTNFQSTLEEFLAKSKEAGKTKLVIDVTANGGGFVVAGYELFIQIFPDVEPFQAHDLRLSESLEKMGRIAASLQDQILTVDSSNITTDEQFALAVLQQSSVVSNLIPGGVFSPDGANLTTVDEILSPVTLQRDRFTAYQQTPLNDTSSTFNLTGTGNRANPPPAVFDPENVVILTDAACSSTCTLFSYLMINQLNIKTVAVGGRPNAGKMQSVAGVEGAQVFPLDEISAAASAVMFLSPESEQEALNGTELGIIAEGYAISRAANPDSPGAVNGKNAFSMTDAETPLQFLYQPANCRFFYTAPMIYGPEEVWKRAVDATWTDPAKFCVDGSQMPQLGVQRADVKFFAGDSAKTESKESTNAATRSVIAGGVQVTALLATWVVMMLFM